ncbi:MAG: YkgJ family cysteine cluster protein [Candidatus Micrarchaeia archaeon]
MHTRRIQTTVSDKDCMRCGSCCNAGGPVLTQEDVDRIEAHLGREKTEGLIYREGVTGDENAPKYRIVQRFSGCAFLRVDNNLDANCTINSVKPSVCRSYSCNANKKLKEKPLARETARIGLKTNLP